MLPRAPAGLTTGSPWDFRSLAEMPRVSAPRKLRGVPVPRLYLARWALGKLNWEGHRGRVWSIRSGQSLCFAVTAARTETAEWTSRRPRNDSGRLQGTFLVSMSQQTLAVRETSHVAPGSQKPEETWLESLRLQTAPRRARGRGRGGVLTGLSPLTLRTAHRPTLPLETRTKTTPSGTSGRTPKGERETGKPLAERRHAARPAGQLRADLPTPSQAAGDSQGARAGPALAAPRGTADQGSGRVCADPGAEGPGGFKSRTPSLPLAAGRALRVRSADPHEAADIGTSPSTPERGDLT